MKNKQIKAILVCRSEKKAPLPPSEVVSQFHIRWIEQELEKGEYDKETKLRIIDGIIERLRAQDV